MIDILEHTKYKVGQTLLFIDDEGKHLIVFISSAYFTPLSYSKPKIVCYNINKANIDPILADIEQLYELPELGKLLYE